MKIGILGTGRMGSRIAAMYARAGHEVIIGSRDIQRARSLVADLELEMLTAGSYDQALDAPIVLPAIFMRDGLLAQLDKMRPALEGKTLIDITNPFNSNYSDFTTPWDVSSAEQIAATLPRTHVVGAFKNVWWNTFDRPDFNTTVSDVLVISDDQRAKQRVMELGSGTPFNYVDSGPLINARTVERMTLLAEQLDYSFFPRA
ncbi:NADPH-dependent F420 reductase [Streptomyces chryseus]